MNWKEYPDELIKGRESAEATFIFCLWKQPDLYDDFPRVNAADDETLKTEDGIFYFSLGRQMFNQGFTMTIKFKSSMNLTDALTAGVKKVIVPYSMSINKVSENNGTINIRTAKNCF